MLITTVEVKKLSGDRRGNDQTDYVTETSEKTTTLNDLTPSNMAVRGE